MVEQLAAEYAAAKYPVIFLEHHAYYSTGNRIDRWYDSYDNRRTCDVPLVMLDSGWRYTCGAESYRAVYSALVNEAVRRRAGADVSARYTRAGNAVDVWVQVTNWAGSPLGWTNEATVNVLVYENTRVVHTSRFVRMAADVPIIPDLGHGQTGTYRIHVPDVPMGDWSRAVVVALVDYRPDAANTAFESVQAAIAVEGLPPSPTATLTATSTATATVTHPPPGTATPAPSSPAPVTATPGAPATGTAMLSHTAHLPWLSKSR